MNHNHIHICYILNCAIYTYPFQVAINLMVNQLLGVSSESEVNEMARLFSDFVDGCLSVPINLPGMAYHTGMKVTDM